MIKFPKKTLFFQLVLLLLMGCKYQSQDFINTKFTIDKSNIENGVYKSKNLDKLFAVENYTYFEPDYVGTAFDEYYVKNIVVQNQSKNKINYILIFDNKNILRDTLKTSQNEVYSLNVKFENNKSGISVGMFDEAASYFKINKNLELNKQLKLKPLALNSKIIDCPLPIEYLSEDHVGIEQFYHYGIQANKTKKSENSQIKNGESSLWTGSYHTNFEISKIDNDFTFNYLITISDNSNVSITEQINTEKNKIQNLFIESAIKDKLVIKSKTDSTLEYIINKVNGKYYFMGNTVYLINPPNDRYLLKKE